MFTYPAVSHICNFILLPPTLIIFDPNSTPIVWDDPSLTEKKNTHTITDDSHLKTCFVNN